MAAARRAELWPFSTSDQNLIPRRHVSAKSWLKFPVELILANHSLVLLAARFDAFSLENTRIDFVFVPINRINQTVENWLCNDGASANGRHKNRRSEEQRTLHRRAAHRSSIEQTWFPAETVASHSEAMDRELGCPSWAAHWVEFGRRMVRRAEPRRPGTSSTDTPSGQPAQRCIGLTQGRPAQATASPARRRPNCAADNLRRSAASKAVGGRPSAD